MQTCFNGRFGDEIANDQFGGHVIFHGPKKRDSQSDPTIVIGRYESGTAWTEYTKVDNPLFLRKKDEK